MRVAAASVSRIVTRLIEAGLLIEETGQSSTPGRPPAVIRYHARAGVVVGIDLGGTKCRGVLADLAGEHVAEYQCAVTDAAFAAVIQVWTELSRQAKEKQLPIRGLGVGIPAVIGRITTSTLQTATETLPT